MWWLLTCGSEPAPPIAPEQVPELPALAPVVAGHPTAGAWRTRVDASSRVFRTMEIVESSSSTASADVWLAPDGVATACLETDGSSHTDISQYASHSGKGEQYDSKSSDHLGLSGRWAASGARVDVVFDTRAYGTCPPGPDAVADPTQRIRWTCTALAPNAKVPSPSLACRVDEDHGMPEALLVPLASGAKWLLLGQPGLVVTSTTEDDGTKLVFTDPTR
jgi:hypothetical protein